MKVLSPLNQIADVIGQIVVAAKVHSDILSKSEATTRAVLIDPLIKALGWDTSDARMVEMEKTETGSRADYVLKDGSGNIRVVIEAKPLGSNLNHSDIAVALISYHAKYNANGVFPEIFLTDGSKLFHYREQTYLKKPPIEMFNFDADDAIRVARYLIEWIDAANFGHGNQKDDPLMMEFNKLLSEVANLRDEMKRLAVSTATASATSPVKGRKRHATQNFIPLSQVNTRGKKPVRLLLPDNSVVNVSGWNQVLIQSAKFAMKYNRGIDIPLPDRVGKTVSLIRNDRPASGVCEPVTYNGREVYIYLTYSSQGCVQNAMYILEQVPIERKQVEAALAF